MYETWGGERGVIWRLRVWHYRTCFPWSEQCCIWMTPNLLNVNVQCTWSLSLCASVWQTRSQCFDINCDSLWLSPLSCQATLQSGGFPLMLYCVTRSKRDYQDVMMLLSTTDAHDFTQTFALILTLVSGNQRYFTEVHTPMYCKCKCMTRVDIYTMLPCSTYATPCNNNELH